MKKKVAILYGFGEGPLIARKFNKTLNNRGFEITDDASVADFIIAHSAGIYFVPSVHKAKCIILDAPSIGDGQTWLNIQFRKLKLDFNHAKETKKLLVWFYKSFLNLLYMMLRIPDEIKMAHAYLKYRYNLPIIQNSRILVIVHKYDPWSSEISLSVRKKHNTYKYIPSDGVHDDLWLHPDYYIDLLEESNSRVEKVMEK